MFTSHYHDTTEQSNLQGIDYLHLKWEARDPLGTWTLAKLSQEDFDKIMLEQERNERIQERKRVTHH